MWESPYQTLQTCREQPPWFRSLLSRPHAGHLLALRVDRETSHHTPGIHPCSPHITSPAGLCLCPLCMSPSGTSAGTTLVSHPLLTHFTLPSNPNCPQAKFPNPYWDPVIQPSLTPTWVLTTPHPISLYCQTSPSALVRHQPPHKGTEGDSPLCPDPSHKLDSK